MRARQRTGIGIAAVWMAAGAGTGAWAQGGLTPPGAPAPTMKTLAQVQPRVPITNAPFTISQPGSYYLVTNLASTGHGIVIQASGVTLDLMGFSLTGDRGGLDCGVWVNGATNAALRDVVVRGGMVSRFGFGVRCDYAQNGRLEGLTVSSNSNYGVTLDGSSGGQCNGNTVRDCAISGSDAAGVYLNASHGACTGNTVRDCSISANISAGVLFNGLGGACNGNTIADCAISGNLSYGIWFDGSWSGACNGNTIVNCAISRNYLGVYLFGIEGECEGNSMVHCVLRGNAVCGIYNQFADGSRIENNHVTGTTGATTYGIASISSRATLILRNTCVGQTTNYAAGANDTCGPIVTDSGILAVTNGAAALSPWANFSR